MAVPATEIDDHDLAIEDELGIAEAMVERADPLAAMRSLARALERSLLRPRIALPAFARFSSRATLAGIDVISRTLTGRLSEPVEVEKGDRRFVDPAWSQNPLLRMLLETYLASVRFLDDLVVRAELEPLGARKAEFAANLLGNAVAPTNALLTNPTAMKRAFDTGGASVLRGMRNFLTDFAENDGWPRQVDRSPFELGVNMAATPGKVVFRNELIEVLQYAPQTDDVHEIPLVVCPPWINRYYIADLAPGKSLVEWAVRHGHTTFAISYRNPDGSDRDTTFDDYMRLGPLAAIDVVRSITGADVVNTLAICLGATMNTMALAYLEAIGDQRVHSSTLLNAAIDYADSGLLADVFADPGTINAMCRRMEGPGFLEAKDMTRTFNLLRANDLIFRYVVDNWLLGEPPPAFDLLAWNEDGTRMPGRAHSYFVRKMYVENALANGAMKAMGEPLVLSDITPEHYIVAAVEDHIVPWKNSYRTTQLVKSPLRFVMTSAGHIAGIVNPPGPKARLWTNDQLPADPDAWRAGATEHAESWWEDWARWIGERAGDRGPAPSVGNAEYPVIADAPGSYVRS
ncbi:MAG: polyhydroxyalkanoate synthase [Acidimicrobiia bacterium]